MRRLLPLMPDRYACARLLGPGHVRVVLYHHVSDERSPLTNHLGIATDPETFESHLAAYARDYDVIGLDDLLEGELPARPLLITFDDAYRSVLDVAGPMLRQRGMPSVFFIATAPIETGRLLLDNLLCFLSNEAGLDALEHEVTARDPRCPTLGQFIGDVIARLPYEQRMQLGARLATRFGVDEGQLARESGLYLHRDDLPKLADHAMAIGNHTASHVHCRALTREHVNDELVRPRELLETWSGSPVRAFSYPYGHHADATPVARQALLDAGHAASFLVHSRTNCFRRHESIWYRVSLTSEPAGELFTNLEVLPRLRTLKQVVRRQHV